MEEEVYMLDDEIFDFDLPVTPPKNSLNRTFTRDDTDETENTLEEDDEDIFIGPVGHKEKCVATHVEEMIHDEEASRPLSPLTVEQQVELFKEAQLVAFHIQNSNKKEQPLSQQPTSQEQPISKNQLILKEELISNEQPIPKFRLDLSSLSPPIAQPPSIVCEKETDQPIPKEQPSLNEQPIPKFQLDLSSLSSPIEQPSTTAGGKRKLADTSLMNSSYLREMPSETAAAESGKPSKTIFSLSSPLHTLPKSLQAVLPKPNIPSDDSGVVKFSGTASAVQPAGSRTVTKSTATKNRRSSGVKAPSPMKQSVKTTQHQPNKAGFSKQPVIKESLLKRPTSRLRPPGSFATMQKRQRRDSGDSTASAASSEASGWSTTSSCSSIITALPRKMKQPTGSNQGTRKSLAEPNRSTGLPATNISRLNRSVNAATNRQSTLNTSLKVPGTAATRQNRSMNISGQVPRRSGSLGPSSNARVLQGKNPPAFHKKAPSEKGQGDMAKLSLEKDRKSALMPRPSLADNRNSKGSVRVPAKLPVIKKPLVTKYNSPKKTVLGSKVQPKTTSTHSVTPKKEDKRGLSAVRKVLSPIKLNDSNVKPATAANHLTRKSMIATPKRNSSLASTSIDRKSISSVSSGGSASSPAIAMSQRITKVQHTPARGWTGENVPARSLWSPLPKPRGFLPEDESFVCTKRISMIVPSTASET